MIERMRGVIVPASMKRASALRTEMMDPQPQRSLS